jgi:tetratricopeptide (TPR) repeat protein
MDNTEYIESYFTNKFVAEQAREFEKRIESDPKFAEEVAFYLSVLNVSREVSQSEKKEHFKKLYQENKKEEQTPLRNIPVVRNLENVHDKKPVRKLLFNLTAAAVVAGIILGGYFLNNTVSPQQTAINFENEKLHYLDVNMGGKVDDIQKDVSLYNEGKYAEALSQFEAIIGSDTANTYAKKYAGITALKLKKYDEALKWFGELQTYNMHSNPAVFYQALTLMVRNQTGDDTRAKQLLQLVVTNKLEGKELAQEWLKRFD